MEGVGGGLSCAVPLPFFMISPPRTLYSITGFQKTADKNRRPGVLNTRALFYNLIERQDLLPFTDAVCIQSSMSMMNPVCLKLANSFLRRSGQFIVDTITSATDALALLDTKVYDAIISDYHMPVMDGIEFLKNIRTSGNTIPFILFTGRGREEIVIQALNEGADFYLQKGGEPVSQFTELSHHDRPCRETETG